MDSEKIKTVPLLLKYLLFYRLILLFMPVVELYSPNIINMASVVLIYTYVIFMYGTSFIIRTVKYVFPIYIVFLLDMVNVGLNGAGPSLAINIYLILQHLIRPMIVALAIYTCDKKFAKQCLYILLICIIITCITTIIGNQIYPGASRQLAALYNMDEGLEIVRRYQAANIGGFVFMYQLSLLLPIFIYLTKSGSINKYIGMLILLLLYLNIFIAEYTTEIIFSLVVLMLFLTGKRIRLKFLLMLSLLGLLFFVTFRGDIKDIFVDLSESIESPVLSSRLYSLSQIIVGDESYKVSDSDASLRNEAYSSSWESFSNNPFLGDGTNGGGHSYILDHMAMYGFFGIVALFIVFYYIYKRGIKISQFSSLYGYGFFAFLMQLGYAALNPYLFIDFFVLIYPLFFFLLSKLENEES